MLETQENRPSDLKLRHAVTDYRNNDIAGILENAVYLELLRQGFSVSTGKRNVVEVDFVESIAGKQICIRVLRMSPAQEVRENMAGKRIRIQARHALTLENIERGFAPPEAIADNYEKLVLSRTRCRRSTTAASGKKHR